MRSWLALSATGLLLSGCALVEWIGGPAPAAAPVLDADLVQRGAALFSDRRLSGDGSRSCASCHPGGGEDHRVYRGGESVDPGTPGGLRTLSLRGLWQTAPYLWDGSAATVRAATQRMLLVEMRGGALSGRDADALDSYLLSLAPFDRGRIQPDGAPVEPVNLTARKGFTVFAEAGCAGCHPAPTFARARTSDVGTGGRFSVPTLRGVATRGPWGHDGRWTDLESAVRAIAAEGGVELGSDQISQLLAYLALL